MTQLTLFGLTIFETWTRNILIKHPTSHSDVLSDFAIMRKNGKDLSGKTPEDVLAAIERLVELGEVTIEGDILRRITDGHVRRNTL